MNEHLPLRAGLGLQEAASELTFKWVTLCHAIGCRICERRLRSSRGAKQKALRPNRAQDEGSGITVMAMLSILYETPVPFSPADKLKTALGTVAV
jgi:hypothetical protein